MISGTKHARKQNSKRSASVIRQATPDDASPLNLDPDDACCCNDQNFRKHYTREYNTSECGAKVEKLSGGADNGHHDSVTASRYAPNFGVSAPLFA